MREGGGRRGLLPALAAALALTACTADVAPPDAGPPPSTSTADAPSAGGSEPAPDRPPVTLAFAGDVHFEGDVAELLDDRDSTVGPLASALRSADVAVVNLESALTSGGARAPKEREDPERRYWFRSPASALGVLERSGVDVVSLANNHGADYGAAGLRDSLRIADAAALDVVGVGDGRDEALRPSVTDVGGTSVAVLAADASPRESDAAVWDVGRTGVGIARAGSRLVAAVRAAAAEHDVVAVYLHWGRENVSCPDDSQARLAHDLATAGADVVVGSHAHRPQGAGLLGDTYVSYGLGNFLWYHGNSPDTGVLRVQVDADGVVGDEWVPGEIGEDGGPPLALRGAERTEAVGAWQDLRRCTDLAPGPSASAQAAPAEDGSAAGLPAYASSVRALPAAVRERMRRTSHTSERCPVGLADLRLLELSYVGFDNAAHTGQLVVHRDHARDVVSVFEELYEARFPVRRMQLVDDYGGDDARSMAADNTSAYNCRTVAGQSTFSQHAYGGAIDLNPVENPYVTGDDVEPPAGRRFVEVDRTAGTSALPGVVIADDVVVRAFARVGWQWGGDWVDPDYQHFDAR